MAKPDVNEIVEIVPSTILVEEKKDDGIFTTRGGLKLKLNQVDPMVIKKAQDAIPLPKRPTYDTVTGSGRKETFPLDDVSAEQVPNGKARWLAYLEERADAFSQRNERIVQITFYYGTDLITPLPVGWEEEHEALGLTLPYHTNPQIHAGLMKAHYLATHLKQKELGELLTAIMRRSGVSEEEIEEAEAAFRG